MLIPENIHPENSIYYNGALVLEAIQNNKNKNLLDLYQIILEKRRMTFSVFILCLDWLFLIDAATLDANGDIELCS
ncbi:MAG: hypothetical protein OEV78_11140 [Spirochaetia bacterium]|nr:hypothetical protein [Spirochaetia bacterium]